MTQKSNEEKTNCITWSSDTSTQRMEKGGFRWAKPSNGGLEQLVTNYKQSNKVGWQWIQNSHLKCHKKNNSLSTYYKLQIQTSGVSHKRERRSQAYEQRSNLWVTFGWNWLHMTSLFQSTAGWSRINVHPRAGSLCDALPILINTNPAICSQVGNRTRARQLKGKFASSAP